MLKVIKNYSMEDVMSSIRGMLSAAAQDDQVRQLAVEITSNKNPMLAVHEWIKSHVQYIPDPVVNGEQTELFISPVRMVRDYNKGKQLSGDCDDHALLSVALFRSIGIISSVVLLDQKNDGWNHAIAQVWSEQVNRFIMFDTTTSFPVGWEEKYVRRLEI